MTNPENIPASLSIAADVAEEEYVKARFQSAVLWSATMVAPLIGIALWAIGIRLLGWLPQAILCGVATYAVLYRVLGEARKMGTMRMKKYKELRAYRIAQKKFEETKVTRDQ